MLEEFNNYFADSLSGVLTNQLVIGIVLSAIVFVLREYYIKFVLSKYGISIKKRIIFEILFFIFIIPASLFVLSFLILILYLISLVTN